LGPACVKKQTVVHDKRELLTDFAIEL
jgi:hypothetical protein